MLVAGVVRGIPARGVAGTREELPGFAELHGQRLAALGAGDIGHRIGFGLAHALGGFEQRGIEIVVEVAEQGHPVLLAFGHLVEQFFHVRGEAHVHKRLEVLAQPVAHHAAQVRGREMLFLQRHVVAVLKGGDDRGISGRAADAELFRAPARLR